MFPQLIPHGLPTGCGYTRCLWAAGDGPLLRGPLPGRREPLPCARSSSCADLSARGAVLSHLSLPSPSCCCTAVRPFLPSALAQRTRRRSRLSSGSDGSLWCSWSWLCSHMGSAGLCSEPTPAAPPLPKPCYLNTVHFQCKETSRIIFIQSVTNTVVYNNCHKLTSI